MRIGIYLRLSSDKDEQRATEAALERQEAACRAVADQRGWTVAQTYTDRDISAFKRGVTRPGFEAMLRDLELGVIDGVITWRLDRLSRNPGDTARVLELAAEKRRAVLSATEPLDTSTAMGELVTNLLLMVARMESAAISARVRAQQEQAARRGQVHLTGRRPYGFTADQLHVDEHEAAVIREAAGRVVAGESLRGVTADLNDRGERTTGGKRFLPANLKRILLNPRTAGLRSFGGQVVAQGEWPAILTPQAREDLLAVFSRTTTRRPRRWLLVGGLARCGRCDYPLYSKTNTSGPRYVCHAGPGWSGCGRLSILAVPLEENVTERLFAGIGAGALDRLLAAEGEAGERQRELAAELGRARDHLAVIGQQYGEGVLAEPAFLAAQDAAVARISRLEALTARQGRGGVLAGLQRTGVDRLRGEWDGWPLEKRRAVLDAFLVRVVVKPVGSSWKGNVKDRVELHWRA